MQGGRQCAVLVEEGGSLKGGEKEKQTLLMIPDSGRRILEYFSCISCSRLKPRRPVRAELLRCCCMKQPQAQDTRQNKQEAHHVSIIHISNTF